MSLDKATRQALNQLAREQIKLKLLADINIDLQVCDIEGWNKLEFIKDLQKLLQQYDPKPTNRP